MNKYYHIEYQETEQTFADMYRLYLDDKSYYFYKITVRFGGILLLFIQLFNMAFTFSVMFFVKFFLLWALAYVAGHFLVTKVLYKLNASSAQKTGIEKYQLRVEKCGTDLNMTLDFRREKFTVLFQNEKKEYSYKEVIRLIENDKFYGIVVGGVYGTKQMIGFPAEALDSGKKDSFHTDMAEVCTNVAKGFKKI